MHEDGALIHLTFDVNLVIASGFKQFQIAFVEGANIQMVIFLRLLLATLKLEGLSPWHPW